MKNCSDFRDNICAYIDNELTADERNSFEKHLETCSECKRETDEMRCIIGLCTNIPQKELPYDFSSDLHKKLVAVAQRQDNKIISIKRSKGYIFTRAVASIAASMLIIFLVGNFYRYGFNARKETKSDLAYSLDQENEANSKVDVFGGEMPASDIEMFSADMEEGADNKIFAMDSISEAAPSDMSGESDRSDAFEQSREVAIAGRKQINMTESASKKYSTITLLADDLDSESLRIRQLALSNSADIIENKATDEESPEAVTMFALRSNEQAPEQTEINIKIQYSQYERFIEELKETYGKADLQVGAFVTEDMSEFLNSNILISNDIDSQINELQKEDSRKNSTEINNLQSKKENVDKMIEDIRIGTDEVTVNIYINKK